ncbi:MAG: segregation/condensation protein A [Verrucomicrobiota bacterium]
MVPDAEYRIKLQVFEGPLDLLLFLIRKNELDIYDIPIESVTRQYIDALHAMRQLDLEVAGEFFVMAATLMEIKSRMLLPKGLHAIDPNADDEEVDPRWELVHQLLQYKKFKDAAVKLAELVETRQNLMARHVSELNVDLTNRPLKSVDRIELWNAFNIVLRRLAEKLVVGEIHDESVTVSDQMEWILTRTQTESTFIFSNLFPEGVTLRRLVATFLAVLELTRLKKLRIRQSEAFTDIIVEAVVPDLPLAPVLGAETAATTTPLSEAVPTPALEAAPSSEAAPAPAPAIMIVAAETVAVVEPSISVSADAQAPAPTEEPAAAPESAPAEHAVVPVSAAEAEPPETPTNREKSLETPNNPPTVSP